jgi:hypothetical protein
MSRYFAEIRVPPFTKGKRENRNVLIFDLERTVCTTLLGEPGGQLTDVELVPVCNTNCPKTPIPRPEEKRGDPRATIPLISSNYNEGPVSTLFLLCDGMLKSSPYPLNLSLALA